MLEKILKLAKAEPGGFTVRLPELERVKTGVVSAYRFGGSYQVWKRE